MGRLYILERESPRRGKDKVLLRNNKFVELETECLNTSAAPHSSASSGDDAIDICCFDKLLNLAQPDTTTPPQVQRVSPTEPSHCVERYSARRFKKKCGVCWLRRCLLLFPLVSPPLSL